jgi:predicted RNA-binding protein with PUA-like domain
MHLTLSRNLPVSYWLLKTEPSTYSYQDLEKDGETVWDGVTNNLALKNIRSMKKGDLAFVYHTGDVKAIVGIATVSSDPFADPRKKDPKLAVIRLKPKEQLGQPVSLAEVRTVKSFADFPLVRLPRLSVMSVTSPQWTALLAMANPR